MVFKQKWKKTFFFFTSLKNKSAQFFYFFLLNRYITLCYYENSTQNSSESIKRSNEGDGRFTRRGHIVPGYTTKLFFGILYHSKTIFKIVTYNTSFDLEEHTF
jgi:hypothetical protein